ncbi:imidazole glycerol phosphate synthase subunit HisH [Virgibacillus sp. YIM 98842]|jgi:glutamine amidotransferase|uniref:imidazole glycerol phosphate synthase subunit HisH n=1 Tax=Virgibacillus sp. YIM 98842 TaxID=2663533 RepID=UPI0013DD05D6|nr:imidazole glycerol phosphate synthase subunit HisH [Virgibacillus sp. YIM 98842]
MIAIIDYGAGNMKSLQFALNRLHLDSRLTVDEKTIKESEAIILPGVGAFHDAMQSLRLAGLPEILQSEVKRGKPILGICLGMQLFYETSYEDGNWEGLQFLEGEVKRISDSVKVPHMGWNTLTKHQDAPLLNQVDETDYVYFVHSYKVVNHDKKTLLASTSYGGEIPAIVQHNNLIGMQFHPEKSGAAGLQLLKTFGEMIS